MDNHRGPYAQFRSQVRRLKWHNLTFGCGTDIDTLTPIINFFAMPAAVIGATLGYPDKESSSAKKTITST